MRINVVNKNSSLWLNICLSCVEQLRNSLETLCQKEFPKSHYTRFLRRKPRSSSMDYKLIWNNSQMLHFLCSGTNGIFWLRYWQTNTHTYSFRQLKDVFHGGSVINSLNIWGFITSNAIYGNSINHSHTICDNYMMHFLDVL